MVTAWIGKALALLGLVVTAQASLGKRLTWGLPAQDADPDQRHWKSPYLPRTLSPVSYEVELWPWLFRESSSGLYFFHGRSSVTFRCLGTTDVIVIHSKMLNYTEPLRVSSVDNTTTVITSLLEEKRHEYLVLFLKSPLQKGKTYTLQTAFHGELTDELVGLYRAEYEEAGTAKLLAITMLQPTDARKVFPCFDEPALKATFVLTVIHRPSYSAISNMPVNTKSEMWIRGQMWIVTTFERTLRMSTYLLACVISEFSFIEKTYHGVTFKVWGRKQLIEAGQGDYALKVAGQLLDFYEEKYDVLYPLPKLDLVAVPSFGSGGMENWGMIVFKEINLLHDPGQDSEGSLQSLLLVVAHELAHQWFGNLVTLDWWNDLWLDEGAATYFSYQGCNFVNPDWLADTNFADRSLRTAFTSDALANSHPLSPGPQEVSTVDQIGQLFDDITYEKGAAVLRMVSSFLSESVFLRGMVSYLKEFSFKTATYADLRTHLQEALNNQSTVKLPDSLGSILDTWVLQMGYPVVTINTTSGLVTQKHFLLDSLANVSRPSKLGYKWSIPVTWQKNTTIQNTIWISKTSAVFVGDMMVDEDTWILANINAVGLFRVNYDNDNWDKLLIILMRNRDAIPVINRAQLIDDAFSLARGNYIAVTRALETTRYPAHGDGPAALGDTELPPGLHRADPEGDARLCPAEDQTHYSRRK
ncbi:aminopeptidase Ey-like [Scyliorhinus torazame]|uniref:aminopeptidase Ey-like n=1 Tax=Scyliorhinus torazame TaxID=75743 RepID=UPI003B5A1AA2